jgi:demethylmenaquinone methyltransferase/2-methoxy-6-polyprenyl-1,4-benzoquinol methylase
MTPADKSHVQGMFGRIAPRYDLMNRLMTLGRDRVWRRFVVQQAQIPPRGHVLDIAAGTGDIAFEARRQYPEATVIAADFALPMMQVGQQRIGGSQVHWLGANALSLPFPENVFDAVLSGFLLRNVPDIDQALREQWRVLKPGGWMVTLDTTPPPDSALRPLIDVHFRIVIPTLGRWLTADGSAYRYLPASTLEFKTPDELVERLQGVGFGQVSYRCFMLKTIAVHWGQK